MKTGKPVKFQRACRLNQLNRKSSMGSSFSSNISFLLEKRFIETNDEINTAIINLKFLFYGGTFNLAADCKKSHNMKSARQLSEAGRSRRTFG